MPAGLDVFFFTPLMLSLQPYSIAVPFPLIHKFSAFVRKGTKYITYICPFLNFMIMDNRIPDL